jgi:hypothetical protein
MIDEAIIDNCLRLSSHKDFPSVFLYPAEVSKYLGANDTLQSMPRPRFAKAVLFQLILLALKDNDENTQ